MEVRREFLEAGPDGRRILAELDRKAREDRLVLVWRLPLPWLLFALVLAAWWPIHPWWQSDDFIALHYSANLGRALSDFTGNQYGLEGVVWFYRPLITLSFAIEQLVAGGPAPFLAHLANAIGHALCACLAGVLAARYLGGVRGFFAGLLWGLSPTSTTAVMWAVGRVDVFSGCFVLLAIVLGLRALDRGARTIGIGAVIASVLAFCCKESALVLPGLMALAAFGAARPGRRVAHAVRTWPVFALTGGYLVLRHMLFGRFLGGYTAGRIDVGGTATGLGDKLLSLIDPLRLVRGDYVALSPWTIWLGLLPIAIALVIVLARRRLGLLAGLVLATLCAAVPATQFWALTGGLDLLRYLYLPAIAVAMLIAAGGPIPALLMIGVMVLPSIELHRDWNVQHAASRAMHEQLLRADHEFGGHQPFFVAGLPRTNATGTAMAFDLGVDRLLEPPFVTTRPRVVRALRTLGQQADVRRLPYGDDRALPFRDATTLALEGPTILATPRPPSLGDLAIRYDGPERLTPADALALNDQRLTCRFTVAGVRAPMFRVTLFAAGGYLTVLVPDRGTGANGVVDVRDVLLARYVANDHRDEFHVAFALEVPVALDLAPDFPVLVEAGDIDGQSGVFVASRANREMAWLRFDRAYAEFIRQRPSGG